MRVSCVRAVAMALGLVQVAHGMHPLMGQIPGMVLTAKEEATLADAAVPLVGNGTFQQPIDHNDLSKGTFSTSFWYNATSWSGPGSPV